MKATYVKSRCPLDSLAGYVLMLLMIAMGSCQAASRARLATRTGGIELTLYIRDHTGAETYYEVMQDGDLGFGGGFAARLSKVTWNGPLTDEEVDHLHSILKNNDWFRTKPQSSHEPPEQRYRLTLNAPEHRTSFQIEGNSPELEPLQHLLANAARRRLEPDLQKLPQPHLRSQ